jgi:hypothetical protein
MTALMTSTILSLQFMNKFFLNRRYLQLAISIILILPTLADAQFASPAKGDLMLGFRKTGANQGNYELVVNAGNISNLLAQAPGTVVPINNYSTSQLTDAFPNYNNLQWSVSATFSGFGTTWDGFAYYTIWFTQPRTIGGVQTTPPARGSGSGAQSPILQRILSIGNNANTLSTGLGTTNVDNNTLLVREPVNNANNYSVQIEDPNNSASGDFHGYLPTTAENATPAGFTSAVVSDLYQSVPVGSVDPNTGTTSGNAYYVGYFTLNPNGTMTFTRASTSVAQPPAPQIVTIARSGNTSTVFFTTTNGTFTYALYYTNSAGLTTSVTNWPSSPTTLVGNGNTNSLPDITTDANRFYRVGAH